MFIALRLKGPPRLSELCGQPGGDALGRQRPGHRGSGLGLEGANPLLRLVALSDGLVMLPAGRTMLRAEPLRGLA